MLYSPIITVDIGLSSTKRVATRFYTYGAGYAYAPTLINFPDILDALPDPKSGAEGADTIVLKIAHGASAIEDDWFEILNTEELRGATISISIYDEVAAVSTFLVSGTIVSTRIGDICEVTVAVRQDAILNTILPKRTINSSLFTATALDAGKTVPIVFGAAHDVPLYNIQEDTSNNYYDYLIGEGVIEGIITSTGRGIKRDGVLVAASEYTLYDGSQGSPFAGFAFIRFTRPQRDFSTKPWSLTGDINGLELGGSTASANMPTWLYNLFINTTWGLGDSADATTFGAVTGNVAMGGAIIAPRTARDIIREWFMHEIDLRIERNSAGAWKIYKLAAGMSEGTFGDADGFYNNCRVRALWRPEASLVPKTLKCRCMKSHATGEYLAESAVAGSRAYGKDITKDLDWCASALAGAAVIRHIWQRYEYDLFIEIEAGIEARARRRGEIITIVCPRITQLASAKDFIIDSIRRVPQVQAGSKTVPGYKIIGREYSASLYTYVVTCNSYTQSGPTNESPGPWTASQFIDNTPFTSVTSAASPYQTVNGGRYAVKTVSGAVTLTLPASPKPGWRIEYFDYNRYFATNNLTLGRNGEDIMNVAADSVRSTADEYATVIYIDATVGWYIFPGVAG